MWLTAWIGDYDMDQVILYLGSDANVLPKQTWEHIAKPPLQWSLIQLRMANQQKILPMGRLQGITVDLDSASTRKDFEIIEIVDKKSPYLVLLGIDWAIDMNGIINFKHRKMIFEKRSRRVVVPLDPTEGPCYMEPVGDDEQDEALDCIYQIAAQRPIKGKVMEEWRISQGYTEPYTDDSEEEDEQWQNRMNEPTTLSCNMPTKSVYCIKAQDYELLVYDGLTIVNEFLEKFERTVPEYQ